LEQPTCLCLCAQPVNKSIVVITTPERTNTARQRQDSLSSFHQSSEQQPAESMDDTSNRKGIGFFLQMIFESKLCIHQSKAILPNPLIQICVCSSLRNQAPLFSPATTAAAGCWCGWYCADSFMISTASCSSASWCRRSSTIMQPCCFWRCGVGLGGGCGREGCSALEALNRNTRVQPNLPLFQPLPPATIAPHHVSTPPYPTPTPTQPNPHPPPVQ